MILESIGKCISGKLLGYAWDTAMNLFRQPQMIEAFEKACIGVIKEESSLFNQHSVQALGSSVGVSDEESLWCRLEQSFAVGNFPRIEQLTEMLVESWRTRKRLLSPFEASEFFSLSEDLALPIIQRISERFFKELAQIPEFKDPFIIQQLQRIPLRAQETATDPPPQTQLSLEKLKDATHEASTSLFIWPTTLGDNQWLERSEVEILLERIDTYENSTTVLLGPPGSGKSALLSFLGHKLKDKGLPVLAIKADKLPSTIDSLEKLSSYLRLPIAVDACLNRLAIEQKTILIVDQLDALSELVDRKSERLNVLLSLIQSVSSLRNVHVVSSSRWFEFRHDTRLNTIQAEHLELSPLSWEQVKMMLTRFGVSDQNWSDEAQAILKVPLHLKIFLDLRASNTSTDISVSLQALLEALWQQRVLVLNRDGAPDRNTFIHELAQRMSEDEELWVSRALADSYPEALEDLVRQEILTLDENGLRIGFRHQTYFDFARARYFAQGRERLSEYVMERQDGLFIRPILLSSLEYLRGSDPGSYRRELLALWNHSDLRSHLRSLLIEFLASLENPNDIEINCLLPILRDESMQHKALIAMSGSHGWFKVAKEVILAELMSKPQDKAALCVSLLTQALPFDRIAVIDCVQKYWLQDPQYDALTLNVLQNLKDWDDQAVNMVCSVAKRAAVWNIPYIAEIVSQSNPYLAPRIVRADLDRRFLEAEGKGAEHSLKPPPPDDASLDDFTINTIPHKTIKELLEGDLGWHELSVIAESAPEAFLEQVWPWFISVLERITGEPHPFVVGYRDDHCLGTTFDRKFGIQPQPASAIRDAIVRLSESDPSAFLNFFRRNETTSLLAVHRLLCIGLGKLAHNYPEVILEYLTKDPRRLTVGDFEDCHRESRTLISCVAPFLDRTGLDVLEKAVLEWNKYYRNEESWTPEERLDRLKWNREHRLRLLRAFPIECLSEQAQRIRNQEERAFPRLTDWDCRFTGVRVVESPMTADQMQKAKDSDILKLFEELVDSTGWDHPRFRKFERGVGGAIQASRQLGSFAELDPVRAASLVIHFKPLHQELAAGAILHGLAKSEFPSNDLFRLVTSLNSAGFSGGHFRTDVAQALEIRARKDKGLPDSIITLMESWLPLHPEPTPDRIQSDKDNRTNGSLIWGLSGAFSLPGGRDLIFDAIAKGYLLREPQEVQGWAGVLERALEYEQHPDVWKVILGQMPPLYNGNKDVATYLYDQVLTRFPLTRESTAAVLAVVSILPWLDDIEIAHKWMDLYRKGEWSTGHQAFGEMLMWHLFHKPTDIWAQNEFQIALKDPQLIDVHLGIAFAAAYNWSYFGCQDLCTSALISLAGSNNKYVHQAISIVFRGNERLPLNNNMRSIIEATLPNDHLLMSSAINLIEGLESFTSSEPQLVFNVCDCFLNVGTEDIKNTTAKYAHLAEPLISIALTLHRMPPPYRERGLRLFERLSESNIQEARQALDTLDRRPLRNRSSRLPRRLRRRPKRRT